MFKIHTNLELPNYNSKYGLVHFHLILNLHPAEFKNISRGHLIFYFSYIHFHTILHCQFVPLRKPDWKVKPYFLVQMSLPFQCCLFNLPSWALLPNQVNMSLILVTALDEMFNYYFFFLKENSNLIFLFSPRKITCIVCPTKNYFNNGNFLQHTYLHADTRKLFTLKTPSKFAADNIFNFFFCSFQKKNKTWQFMWIRWFTWMSSLIYSEKYKKKKKKNAMCCCCICHFRR